MLCVPTLEIISIHALLAESDVNGVGRLSCFDNFYPRSPCGERLKNTLRQIIDRGISIHALLAESDTGERHPVIIRAISIHALLAESDCRLRPPRRNSSDFYPRSPCGERLWGKLERFEAIFISIHALLAESDAAQLLHQPGLYISIHALLAESDTTRHVSPLTQSHFYPRSPCGERPAIGRRGRAARGNFYPRSPCGERPILGNPCAGCPAISIHALLAESDAVTVWPV